MMMDCSAPLFPDETHFEDMFDDTLDFEEEPESPCGITGFDVERAAMRKAQAVRRAPRLPGLQVDAIHLDSMISPRASDNFDGFLTLADGALAFDPVATPLGTPRLFLSPSTTPKDVEPGFWSVTPPPIEGALHRWAGGLQIPELNDAAITVAHALLRAEHLVGGNLGQDALACVEAITKLDADAATGAVALAEAATFTSSETLLKFTQTLGREADKAVLDARARRAAWRPLAAYRAAHNAFEPTFAEEAALAFKLWADLGQDTFDAATLGCMEAKTVACDLALLLDRLFTGDDARKDVNAVRALGRAGGVVVQRATIWGADDVRQVLNLVAAVGANHAVSVDLFTHFVVALELATRRKKRPSKFKKNAFAQFVSGTPFATYTEDVPEAAASLLRKVLQTAGQRGVVALAGVDLLPHDDAYETHVRTQALSRLTASALVPVKGAWGGSLWRLDASFADSLPQEMNLGDPRAFALALVTHNAMDDICAPATQLVEDAERFGGVKAAWETPYELHVSRTVTMLCADFVARDPQNEITALAQTVQFVGRE